MIKITNGSIERDVTKGAFENLYKKMGFVIANEKVSSKPEVTKNIEKEDAKESKDDSKESKDDSKESEKDSKRPSR